MTKDREIAEHECEERAMEEANKVVDDVDELFGLIVGLEEIEQWELAMAIHSYLSTPALPPRQLYGVFQMCAYRRALAAERRKEGLE